MTQKRYRTMLGMAAVMLVLGSVLINMKNIFTSCQVDAEYQVAMAYRIVRGDMMFSRMWEAHQTSAFFLAFFEWIFLKVTGSTTGIMVYANAVGVCCKTAVAFCVYGVLRKYADKRAAFMALLFALNAWPKDIVLPDFANLQIWFGLLIMCCMICYLQNMGRESSDCENTVHVSGKIKKRRSDRISIWLVLAGLCLCLQVLSYPSCVLSWLGCAVLIWLYSDRKMRDICVLTGVCAVCGGAYLFYFMRGNPAKFIEYVFYIWSGDESHAIGPAERLGAFGQDLLLLLSDMRYILVVAVCAGVAAWGVRRGYLRLAAHTRSYAWLCWFLAFYILGYLLHLPKEDAGTKYHFFLLYGFVEIAAWMGRSYLNDSEKRIFAVGQAVGICGFFATLLLSDMGLFSAFPYLIPAMCGCMLPLVRLGEIQEKADIVESNGKRNRGSQKTEVEKSGATWEIWNLLPALLLCMVLIFRNFIYLNGWMEAPANFKEDSIFGTTWTAQYGPLKGIRNGDGAYVADITWREWQDMIRPGDRVLVLSFPTLPAAIYLNQDVDICVDSTISTPTYSERLLAYWKENPDKYPNVVVVKSFAGSPMMGEYNAVTKWLDEEFPAVRMEDGTYWRYYFAYGDGDASENKNGQKHLTAK